MHHAITEFSWLKLLLMELVFGSKKPVVLFYDNMTVTKITNNLVHHDRTKHIELDRNFIQDNIDCGTIEVPYNRSLDKLADLCLMASLVDRSIYH